MNRKWLRGVLSIALVFALGAGMTFVLIGSPAKMQASDQVTIARSEYDTLIKYQRLEEIRTIMEDNYYQPLDDQTLLDGAAKGMMMAANDPYTFYYTPAEMAAQQQHFAGKYAGVGLQVLVDQVDNLITVTRVFKGSPALAAGMQPGDKIVRVDSTDVTGYDLNKAVDMMKGDPGSAVKLTVLRGGNYKTFTITRATININRVEYSILDGNIGYILLYEFMGDDVTGFMDAIRYFQKQNVKGLIIDVRDNPGGLLSDVVAIADQLVPQGLIVYTEDKHGNRQEYNADSNYLGLPLVVLVNENSASASEILAGAVQDRGAGAIVGTTTFGKGIVQSVHTFTDGAGLQLTTARYFTPNGVCIHQIGVHPNVYVDLPADLKPERALLTPDQDTQLQKGIEVVKQMMAGTWVMPAPVVPSATPTGGALTPVTPAPGQ